MQRWLGVSSAAQNENGRRTPGTTIWPFGIRLHSRAFTGSLLDPQKGKQSNDLDEEREHSMKPTLRAIAVLLGLMVTAWSGQALAGGGEHSQETHDAISKRSIDAKAGHSHEKCQLHGGQVSMTKENHFETMFAPDGIRVYRYSGGQVPMMVGKVKGTATLQFKDGAKKEIDLAQVAPADEEATAYFCPEHPEATQMEPGVCEACGSMGLMKQDYLFGQADLSEVEPGSMKAVVKIEGMGGTEPDVVFTVHHSEGTHHHEEHVEAKDKESMDHHGH
jgi:hypothetical protein